MEFYTYDVYTRIFTCSEPYDWFLFQVQLTAKRDKLCDQLMEARDLKTNIDRRSSNVARMLSGYLDEETFQRYQAFLRTKTRLIVESRDLQERITLDEEKLAAIKETS